MSESRGAETIVASDNNGKKTTAVKQEPIGWRGDFAGRETANDSKLLSQSAGMERHKKVNSSQEVSMLSVNQDEKHSVNEMLKHGELIVFQPDVNQIAN